MFIDVLQLAERREVSDKEKRQGAALAKRAAYAGFGGGDEESDAPGLRRQASKQFGRERYESEESLDEKGLPKGKWWASQGKTPWGAKPSSGSSKGDAAKTAAQTKAVNKAMRKGFKEARFVAVETLEARASHKS